MSKLFPFLNSPEDGPWRIDVLKKNGTALPEYIRSGVARVHRPKGSSSWYEYAIGLDAYFLSGDKPDYFWHVSVDRYAPILAGKRFTVTSDTNFEPKNTDPEESPYEAADEYHGDGWYSIVAMPSGNGISPALYRVEWDEAAGVWNEEIWSAGGNSLPWPFGNWIRWTISYFKPLEDFTPSAPLALQHRFSVAPG